MEHQILEPVRGPETGHAISPVIAAALCIKPSGKLTSDQRGKSTRSSRFSRLHNDAQPRHAFQRYHAWPPSGSAPCMDRRRHRTGLTPIVRSPHLEPGLQCGQKAIEMPCNNGQAEGQINRLKTLKRAMYGRAGPELLRARMLPSATQIEAEPIKGYATQPFDDWRPILRVSPVPCTR